MNDYNVVDGKIDAPDTAYLLEQFNAMAEEGFDYRTIAIVFSKDLAVKWVKDNESTITIPSHGVGIDYPVRRYGRMRVVYKLFDGV